MDAPAMEKTFSPLSELLISTGIRTQRKFELWCLSRSE
jgi:hypothetical protein